MTKTGLLENYKTKIKEKDKEISQLKAELEKAEISKQIIAQTNRLLDQELYKSTIVTKVGEIASSISDYNKMAKALMELIGHVVNYDAALLLSARGEDKTLSVYINTPIRRTFLDQLEKKAIDLFNKKANSSLIRDRFIENIISGEVKTPDLQEEKINKDKEKNEKSKILQKEKLNSFCASMLQVGDVAFGVIAIGSKRKEAFAKGELDSFNLIAGQARIIVDDAVHYRDLKAAHEKLKVIDQMKSDFISHVSHELRTPLATMYEANAQLLEGLKGPLNEGQRRFLEISQNGVERLMRIISNLLDISRIEAGKIRLDRKSVDITALAREVIDSLRPQADKKHISLEDRLPSSLPKVFVDPDRIRQVFTNIVGNAIKYTQEGGKIALMAEQTKNALQASVADTGIGIPPEYLDRIFDRFERVSKVPVSGVGGAGLGLSISKELLAMHKGKIWAESKVNKGSKFTLSLPIYKESNFVIDYLQEQIQEAKKHGFFVSLITANIENFSQLKKEVGDKEIPEIHKHLEDFIAKFIREPLDKVFKYKDGMLALVLSAAPKKDGQAVERRIKDAATKYEIKINGKTIKLSLKFKRVTYPIDGQTEDELIKAAGG